MPLDQDALSYIYLEGIPTQGTALLADALFHLIIDGTSDRALSRKHEVLPSSLPCHSIGTLTCRASLLDMHGNGIHDDHITLHCFLSVGAHVFLQGIYHCLSARIGRIQEAV